MELPLALPPANNLLVRYYFGDELHIRFGIGKDGRLRYRRAEFMGLKRPYGEGAPPPGGWPWRRYPGRLR